MCMFRLYFLSWVHWVVCVCGSVTIFLRSWCLGCELDMMCVPSLVELALLRSIVCVCVCVYVCVCMHYIWYVLVFCDFFWLEIWD